MDKEQRDEPRRGDNSPELLSPIQHKSLEVLKVDGMKQDCHLCPLCGGADLVICGEDGRRPFLRCGQCGLVSVPPAFHLSPDAEKAHYDTHENHPDDPGYRRFLSRLFDPMVARLQPGDRGLEYGCGPGPALAAMFEERGHPMALYDLYYRADAAALESSYDFVTATEVIEHLARPREVLELLWSLITPGGWLGLMTTFCDRDTDFSSWYYKNDLTHIAFFERCTFAHIGQGWGVAPLFPSDNVVLFHKPPEA